MKQYQFPLFFILLTSVFIAMQGLNPSQAQDPFITTWKTDNTCFSCTNSNQIAIPVTGTGYNFTVDWGDGSMTSWQDGDNSTDLTHTYATADSYTVEISGSFPRIHFLGSGDRTKIISVDQWGDIAWETMEQAFMGAENLQINAADAPDLSGVTSLAAMFANASSMNNSLNHWDVSTITDMSSMFHHTDAFNGNIGDWDVSGVEDMSAMFNHTMTFNVDISDWDVSGVTDMSGMFYEADAFNQNISSWNVSSVQIMREMFLGSDTFNQDISGWDVSNVASMIGMFHGASAFDQNLGGWDIGSVTGMNFMLNDSGLSTANYDATLIGWAAQTVFGSVQLGANNLTYCAGASARQSLIDDDNWTITGDVLETGCSAGTDPFVTVWKTDNPGVSDLDEISIPITGTGYDFTVDWGDGAMTTWQDGDDPADLTHIYPIDDTYTVEITGDFPRIYFYNDGDPSDAEKILSVDQWGGIEWSSMENAFYGATNLVVSAIDAPDLSGVTILQGMFRDASSLNSDLNHWDVSTITDMQHMFHGASAFDGNITGWDVGNVQYMTGMFAVASAFNQPIGNWDVSEVAIMSSMFSDATAFNQHIGAWDVSKVQAMNSMFTGATVFNQDIGSWNTSNVTGTIGMFYLASAFNQDISGWDVSGVTSMYGMFWFAGAFNQDIGGWNVANVANMDNMFREAASFNQDLGSWDVSNVTTMEWMFFNATAFDQSLGSWNIGNVTSMADMLNESALSTANYDATLIGWAGQSVQDGVTLDAQDLEYCSGQAARNDLISNHNWTINGDILASDCDPFVLLAGVEGFRMLSSPVEGSLADLLDPVWTQGATTGADYSSGDPNVWIWDNTIPGDDPADWLPVTDLSATVSAGTGLLVYVFDEDEYGNSGSAVWPKTLSVSGTANSLPVSPTINTNPGGFTLLGNPVNTGIDWHNFTRSEVDNVVYVWDPNKGSGGDWVFWDGATGDLTGGVIHPFQGFFVRTSTGASSPSLEIPASATISRADFFGKQITGEPLEVRLQLQGADNLESTAWLRFSEQGSLNPNRGDAVKLQPLSADYAVLGLEAPGKEDPSLLALKHLPLDLDAPLEIPLAATSTRGGRFTLEATQLNLPDGWKLTLHDTQTGEERQLTPDTEYTFELETNEKLYKTSGTDGSVPLTPRPLIQPSDHLKQSDGSESRFILLVTLGGPGGADLPERIALAQNYPNPFNPSTVISYQLPVTSDVRLEVYDMLGRRIATLVDEAVEAGAHQVNFDAGSLSSGVYLYRLQTGSNIITKKLTLIK